MLWPLTLPFWITLVACVVLVSTATAVAPWLRVRRGSMAFVVSFLCVLAFIPSCLGVMTIVDRYRFGMFHYAAFDDVTDRRVAESLPPTATDITVERRPEGFRARYRISQADLVDYVDAQWTQWGSRVANERVPPDSRRVLPPSEFQHVFRELNWPPPSQAIEYDGPRAAEGSGWTIWYSADDETAYQRAGYW